jgi:hypothetical protein
MVSHAELGHSLNGAGHNEDGWSDVAPAARLAMKIPETGVASAARVWRALSGSTGASKLAASVVSWNVLVVAAWRASRFSWS